MRFYEIYSGYKVFISEEEQELVDNIELNEVKYSLLDEREQEVARKLISRGVLNSKNDILSTNSARDLWRF